jgi:hypothetical protein
MSRKVARQTLVFKKNSPHIFFGVGIAGFVGTVVLSSRATLKLNDTLAVLQDDITNVKGMGEDAKEGKSNYTEREYRKDLVYVYAKGAGSLAKLYGPSAALGVVSIGALTGSHVAMTRRNTALSSTLLIVQKAYDDYRQRVRDEYGEEKELDLYHAAHDKKVKGEDGKNETIKVANPNRFSPYAKFFDESSPYWEKSPELNRLFVQCQQSYANDLLLARGHLFLNEVYDMFGIERSKAGSIVGWVVSKDGTDNYVDFGLFEASNANFVNGWERSMLLDFNVNGQIYDKI